MLFKKRLAQKIALYKETSLINVFIYLYETKNRIEIFLYSIKDY
jgi:hypothetical protein